MTCDAARLSICSLPFERVNAAFFFHSRFTFTFFCFVALQADAELRLYCAFSFPAVVITVGPNRWGEVRESFAALLRDPSWAVRKTLSHSLHEVGCFGLLVCGSVSLFAWLVDLSGGWLIDWSACLVGVCVFFFCIRSGYFCHLVDSVDWSFVRRTDR